MERKINFHLKSSIADSRWLRICSRYSQQFIENLTENLNMFITLIFCYFFINQEELQNFLIPQMEINGRRKLRIVRYQIYCKLNSLVENRGSIFEKCYPISLPLAHKMLVFSYKFPSSFSQWDPIKVKKKIYMSQYLIIPIILIKMM